MKLNRQGFTLVELLAALVILGLLMVVAAPNVLGILNRNKSEIYVEDAKKLVARAEYVMRGDTSISKPNGTGASCIAFSLGYLDNSEFNDPPQGGEYFINKSYVKVCKVNYDYKYYVQLLECDKKDVNKTTKKCNNANGYKGIKEMDSEELYKDTAISKVVTGTGFGAINSFSPSPATNKHCDLDVTCGSGTENAIVDDDN